VDVKVKKNTCKIEKFSFKVRGDSTESLKEGLSKLWTLKGKVMFIVLVRES